MMILKFSWALKCQSAKSVTGRAIENQLFIFLKSFFDVSIKTDSSTIKLFFHLQV